MIGNSKEITAWLFNQENYDQNKKFKIEEYHEKRSLNANSYCWVLLQKLADVLKTDKISLYRKYIQEKGIFRAITLDNKAVDTFIKLWNDKGLGWLVEVVNEGNTFTDINAYYGSSSYNTKQMANFIDYIVEECKLQGIETIPPEELERLKMEWK